ncbi:hypothetical protein NC651_008288 [Populus alba x Populus x berolinensis]|nr:hypothetical protein NC651_008288 [Populus alba x Populus x berolinensis]
MVELDGANDGNIFGIWIKVCLDFGFFFFFFLACVWRRGRWWVVVGQGGRRNMKYLGVKLKRNLYLGDISKVMGGV